LQRTEGPFRVLNLPGAYPGSSLMAYRVPQLLGYHGNELHAFDQLLGGKNQWRYLGSQKLWDLYAVRFVITPAERGGPDSIPGFVRRTAAVTTAAGTTVTVFERVEPPAYAWVAAGAVKLSDSAAVPAALDPRLPRESVVLLAEDAPVTPSPLQALPTPLGSRAEVTAWEPGRMTIHLEPAPPAPGYVVIAENWYPDWRASVDGRDAPTLRANVAQLAVPVEAGAREVRLAFHSDAYARGRLITALSLLAVVGLLVGSRVRRRRPHA
jgi:hypothetical protein